ncbi:MAG: S1C family serine protease [Candidatus Nanopelagicaceae bacterium]
MTRTPSKVLAGFLLGVTAVGGVATAAGVFSTSVVNACVDKKTQIIYAAANNTCPSTRTGVTLGAPASAAASLNTIVNKVSPSVVTINVTTASGGGTGSGSIFKSTTTYSYVLTNNHVIESAIGNAGTITVELDNGDAVTATIVGREPNYDLAILKINKGNQPIIELGDSSSLKIGDQVIAFGSPLGLDHTVTSGIISSLNRPVVTSGGSANTESYVDAIQTDAAINPGNSGGPLTDSLGRMVGINAATATLGSVSGQSGSIGLGFAIPMNQALRVMNEIIATGKATRPVLGVFFDQTFTSGKGAKISSLTPNDGAQKAGIPAGAIITSIDGARITDYVSAIVRIRSHAPGDTVTVVATLPTGESKSYTVTLGSAVSN